MGGFYGAQTCEVVRLYLRSSNLENILPKTNFGLYQNDGLILLRNINGQKIDKRDKSYHRIFRRHWLQY